MVKEALISWRGPFTRKEKKQMWKTVPMCIFWFIWKERNRIVFRDGRLAVQRLNNSFGYNLWSWNMFYLGEEASSLLGFFLSR